MINALGLCVARGIPLLALGFVLTGIAWADPRGVLIGLDPGHGGTNAGAIGPTGLREADVNLTTALALRSILEADGFSVVITRTADVDVSLASRSNFLNSNGADRAISVHHNSVSDLSVNRTMDFVFCDFCSAIAGDLASFIVQRAGTATGLPIGPAASTTDVLCISGTFSCGRAGVGQANLHMVRETSMPAVIVEISFISNPAEETRLQSSSYLQGNALAIHGGLVDSLAPHQHCFPPDCIGMGDSDGDLACDACDNCPLIANADQADEGGVASLADVDGLIPDGIGDLCQCGDVTLDGSVNRDDVSYLRDVLAGLTAPFTMEEEALCSVAPPIGACGLLEVVILRRTFEELGPGISQLCIAAAGASR